MINITQKINNLFFTTGMAGSHVDDAMNQLFGKNGVTKNIKTIDKAVMFVIWLIVMAFAVTMIFKFVKTAIDYFKEDNQQTPQARANQKKKLIQFGIGAIVAGSMSIIFTALRFFIVIGG